MSKANDMSGNSAMGQALVLWQKVTGINPDANSMSIGGWGLLDTFKKIQEAIELDPTEITAFLLLTYFHNQFLEDTKVSMAQLLGTPEQVAQKLAPSRELNQILNNPSIIAARDRFIDAVGSALAQYGVSERGDIRKVLEAPDQIAILRRDALRSIANLRVDQFLDGASESPEIKPVYVTNVHQWWNMNSLLDAVTRMPSGVSLNLIRHPDGFQSYFAFVIRNGGNVFVLSDTPNYAHPLQGYMSRRPDRALSDRASRNWFPYDLLGVEYDEDSGRLYLKESSVRAIVAHQADALPLKPLSELDPCELIWVSMMFDLIVERFWHQKYKAPSLSYTAEMLKAESVLIEAANDAGMPVAIYKPMALPRLTHVDVSDDVISEKAIGPKYNSPNKWLEERYGAQVPEEALNLVAAPEVVYLLDNATSEIVRKTDDEQKLGHFATRDLEKTRTTLRAVDATSFGSRKQMQNDRLFIARHNFATQIGALAQIEFETRKNEVASWYQAQVEKNIDTLLSWVTHGSLWVDDGIRDCFSGWDAGVGLSMSKTIKSGRMQEQSRSAHTFMRRYDVGSDIREYPNIRLGGWSRDRGGYPTCVINDSRASYYVVFYPTCPEELALLAGCTVAELPDVLQHWTISRPYRGNAILNRIDPMVWKLANPWSKLDLRVRMPLSKRALAALEKKGLQPCPAYMAQCAPWDAKAEGGAA